jgi:bHLH factor
MDSNIQSLHHKTSYKRKRDTPDPNGNKRQANQRPSSSSNNVHGNGHAINTTHEIFSNDTNSNEFVRIGQQIQAHIANADPSTAAAALAANMPQLTVPRPTELSFPSSGSGNDVDRQLDSSFDMGGGSDGDQHHHNHNHNHNHNHGPPYNLDAYQGDPAGQTQTSDGGGGTKPAVGTDEWHKVRRDNHKEG